MLEALIRLKQATVGSVASTCNSSQINLLYNYKIKATRSNLI